MGGYPYPPPTLSPFYFLDQVDGEYCKSPSVRRASRALLNSHVSGTRASRVKTRSVGAAVWAFQVPKSPHDGRVRATPETCAGPVGHAECRPTSAEHGAHDVRLGGHLQAFLNN